MQLVLEAAVKESPDNQAAYLTLGNLYQRSGNIDSAIKTYERAVASSPNYWAAHNNLAYLLAEHHTSEDSFKRALRLAQHAEKLRPEDPTIMDTVGWVQYKSGELDLAMATFERALAKQPDSGIINYHLGQLLFEKDRKHEAREKLEKAIADDAPFPGKAEAKALLNSMKKQG
jgi:Tfp pilus assembly protein PilF